MPNTGELVLSGFAQGVGILAKGFGDAFIANPWPFLAVGGLVLLRAIVPRVMRR